MSSHCGYASIERQFAEPLVHCSSCNRPIAEDDASVVEVANTRQVADREYFCNAACRSRHLFEVSDPMAQSELRRLLAALFLLTSNEPRYRIPALAKYEADSAQYGALHTTITLDKFKQMASAFLDQLAPSGEELMWTVPACDAADELQDAMGRVGRA